MLAVGSQPKNDNTKVLVKLFQKLAGCRDGVPAKGFGERSSPIDKKNSLIP